MLRAAIAFFVIGLIAFALGAGNLGGLSMEIGKTLLIVFMVLAVLSLLVSLFTGHGPRAMVALLTLGAGLAADPDTVRDTSSDDGAVVSVQAAPMGQNS